MAVIGTNVTAANYNTIQGKIQDVLGVGDGAQNGYGRTLASSTKSSGDIIAAQDMADLYTDLLKARKHQANPVTWTNAAGLAAPSADENVGASAADVGNDTPINIESLVNGIEYQILSIGTSDFTLINASANEVGIKFVAQSVQNGSGDGQAKLAPTSTNAEEDLAEGYLDFEAAADEIVADINVHDATNFSVTTKLTDTRTTQWGGGDYATPGSKITHEVEVTWLNADERRYFFNTGGSIIINADLIGAVTANSKNDHWNTILENMGTIIFSKNATTSTGSNPGTGSNIGNYYASWALTSVSNQATLFTKNGSGLYADIKYQITAWEEAAGNASTPSTLRFRIEFQDNDFSTGTGVDEYVTNNITSTVSVAHDTVLGIVSPSFTTITSLDDGAASQTSATLSRAPAGPINEGEDVTFTLQVSPVANGSLIGYTLSGSSIEQYDLAGGQQLADNFNMQNGSGSVTITISEDEVTEGSEVLTLSVPDFGLSSSIGINDTSTTPVNVPPPTPTYSLSGPASINEDGTANTYTVTTTNFTGSTLYWSIDGTTSDFTAISGPIPITNQSGTFDLTAIADGTTEGTEAYTLVLRTDSTSGPEVGTSLAVEISDTSTTAAPYTGDEPVVPNLNIFDQGANFNAGASSVFLNFVFRNDFTITIDNINGSNEASGDWLPNRTQGETAAEYEIFITAGTMTTTGSPTPVLNRGGSTTGTWLPLSSNRTGSVSVSVSSSNDQTFSLVDTVQIRKISNTAKSDSGNMTFSGTFTDLGGLICLTNEMIVQEYNKGFVKVYEIETGDSILGADGYTKVLDITKDHPREGYWILDNWLEITNDHPVLTDDGWIRAEDYTGNKEYKQIPTDTVYIETADEAFKVFNTSANVSMLVSGQYKEQS